MSAACFPVQITFLSPGISSRDSSGESRHPPRTHRLEMWQL